MTAREQLINTGVMKDWPDFNKSSLRYDNREALERFLARPDLLLAVLAETGVLTEETGWPHGGRRFVSPWGPSGDQT